MEQEGRHGQLDARRTRQASASTRSTGSLSSSIEGAVSVVGSDGPPDPRGVAAGGRAAAGPPGGRGPDRRLRAPGPLRPAGLADQHGERRKAVVTLAVPRDCRVEPPGGLGQPDGRRAAGPGAGQDGQRRDHPCRPWRRGRGRDGLGGGAGLGVTGRPVGATPSRARSPSPRAAGSVRARTISGTIAMDLGPPGTGTSSCRASPGDLTVRLPEASDLEVKLQSTSGQVASAFGQLEHDRTPAGTRPGAGSAAGTGRLRASSTSGHVALLRRAPGGVGTRCGVPDGLQPRAAAAVPAQAAGGEPAPRL